jgi:Mn-dependent DtxR family transcriptional regulator
MLDQEDIARMVLELIYRNHRRMDETLSLEKIQKILEISVNDLTKAISSLEEKGYLELKNEHLFLKSTGVLIMNQREFSYCPYL